MNNPIGKKDLKRYKFSPIAGCSYPFQGPDKKCKNKRANKNTQTGSEKIVMEVDPGQGHAEIHGCEWEIDHAQVEYRRKSVSLNGILMFFEPVSDK